jgi:hypothetical protein
VADADAALELEEQPAVPVALVGLPGVARQTSSTVASIETSR